MITGTPVKMERPREPKTTLKPIIFGLKSAQLIELFCDYSQLYSVGKQLIDCFHW